MYQTKIISITIKKIRSITLTELRLDRASRYIGAIATTTDNSPFLCVLWAFKKPKNKLTERKKIINSENKNTTERKILFWLGLKKVIKAKKINIDIPNRATCCFVFNNILEILS